MRHVTRRTEPMRIAGALLLGTVVMSLHALAQQKTETTVYKVEFNIHDGSDLRAKAGRRYTILVLNNSKSVFKVGDRVPYSTGNALYTLWSAKTRVVL